LQNRVVITGMGIVAPNGHGLDAFENALRKGISGIRFQPRLKDLNFGCQVGGIPENIDDIKTRYFNEDDLMAMNSNMFYANIAAIDCWRDAGLAAPDPDRPDKGTGAIVGTGLGGGDTFGTVLVPGINEGKVRRLGSSMVEQIMSSSITAKMAGLLGLGNQVTTNSSACTTGTEAIVMAFDRIRFGMAERMLAGGSEGSSHYVWGSFDAMRVLNRNSNNAPEKASRPMSASAGGFIPGSGAGILMLESLESAQRRNARIYAEILGGTVNCGGHRQGGSMTAPNPYMVQECIRQTTQKSGISAYDIDAINGHLTATFADPMEVKNWAQALNLSPEKLPWINSTKSLIGHGLGSAGGMECVAVVLQLDRGFVHGSLNCEDLHEELLPFAKSIPQQTVEPEKLKIIAKASFGFGDVNGCVIFKKWNS